MSPALTSLRRYRWLASLLVVVFALRALVPTGFMPGGEGSLGLQVCPEGLPAALLAGAGDHAAHAGHHHHHHPDAGGSSPGAPSGAPSHDHKSWMSGHCVFSAVAGAPPLAQVPLIASVSEVELPRADAAAAPVRSHPRFLLAQPRAPPPLT
jgi:hypothetical protein